MSTPRSGLRGVVLCPVAALFSVVMPGAGHLAVRARRRGWVVAAAAINVVAMVAFAVVFRDVGSGADMGRIIGSRRVFVFVGFLLLVMAATRLATAADSAWQARPDHGRGPMLLAGVVAFAMAAGGSVPLAYAARYVWITDRTVASVFGDEEAVTAQPGTIATTVPPSTAPPSTEPGATTTVAPATTTTEPPPFPGVDRVNILLLGGDAGPGRWSLRTDSMIVVSIDPATGDTAMISVPRNLAKLPFPPGTKLAEKFPDGFTDLANAVYPYVNGHRDLNGGGEDAGALAVKMGIAQLLGIPLHYYVLVDMAGFVDVVDALGGIDIEVFQKLPTPGNPRNAKHPVPEYFTVGEQHMDGTLALAYARTREADSDYRRMERQRCVLGAIADAATPAALATGLPALMGAIGKAVQTDIPRSKLGELGQVVEKYDQHGGLEAVRTLQLTPPVVQPSHWKADKVRQLVADLLANTPPADPTAVPPVLAKQCSRVGADSTP